MRKWHKATIMRFIYNKYFIGETLFVENKNTKQKKLPGATSDASLPKETNSRN